MTRLMHLTTVDMSLELLLGHQIRSAQKAGYEVVGVSAPGPWVKALESDGMRHVPLPTSTRGWNLRADLQAALEFWRILRREQPEILHTHNPKPGLYGRLLGRLARVPIVINTVHGLYAAPDDPITKRAFFYAAEAVAARLSDHELVQSAEDVELMGRLHIAPRGHVTHLGNGVDLEHFDPAAVSKGVVAALRDELGSATGIPVVGVVGRLVAEKGFVELFEAVRMLRGRGGELVVLVIGPTDEDKADALSSEEIERAEADGVRFLGLRQDMRELYSLMNIFVLASHREGFPRAAMEAAAMEVPIVATDIRGCREVVEEGLNGLLVPVRDAAALALAIDELLKDPSRRQAMGEHGRLVALERFDARKVAGIVLDTYERVAATKGIALLVDPGVPEPAVPRDARAVAELHLRSIPTGFLASLGLKVLTQIYRGLTADPQSVVLVVRDLENSVVGFVAGSANTGRLYKRILRRRALPLGIAALPSLVAHPARMGKAFETLRYPSEVSSELPEAELLSMAVSEGSRSRGLGTRLVSGLLADLGSPEVRVVVGSRNLDALRFYTAHGFVPVGKTEVHSGEPSELLVWHSSRL